MKMTPLKWLLAAIASPILLILIWVGCSDFSQSRTEARVRHYFGLARNESLTDTNIQSALLSQFPIGTSRAIVESSLAERGLNKDGKSMMWQTNGMLYYAPNPYSDGFISMRRIEVWFSLDDQQKVKAVDVSSFSYSL